MSTVDTTVGVAMTSEVLGIVPGASLEVALRMMVETGVRHLPVVDRGRCVGLLHESDVLWRLWSTAGAPPLAAAVARAPVVSVGVSDDLRAVARRLVDAETDAAVVTEDGRIVGIVTVTDLLRRLAED
jgi:predicted transcriptional regulator